MKKTLSFISSLFTIFFMMFSVVGCHNEPAEKKALSIVLSHTANVSGVDFSLLNDPVYDVIRSYGFISVVNADSKPEVLVKKNYEINDQYKSAAAERLNADAKTKANNLIASMRNSIVADDEELDLLESLRLAATSLNSLNGYNERTIAVFSNGLSTAGEVNYQNNLLSAPPQLIVDMLKERKLVPSFNDIKVLFFMLDTAEPQEKLQGKMRERVKDFWQGVVEAGGGKIEFVEALPVAAADREYPFMSCVDIPTDLPIEFNSNTHIESIEPEGTFEPLVLGNELVNFLGDNAEFADEDAAYRVLNPIAECLVKNDISLIIAGACAGDTDTEKTKTLSLERAERVREALILMGVDPDRLHAVGLACTGDPYHIYGAGVGDDPIASQNRKVIICDSRSDLANQILANLP